MGNIGPEIWFLTKILRVLASLEGRISSLIFLFLVFIAPTSQTCPPPQCVIKVSSKATIISSLGSPPIYTLLYLYFKYSAITCLIVYNLQNCFVIRLYMISIS